MRLGHMAERDLNQVSDAIPDGGVCLPVRFKDLRAKSIFKVLKADSTPMRNIALTACGRGRMSCKRILASRSENKTGRTAKMMHCIKLEFLSIKRQGRQPT
jgi:hypothetical protein